MKYTSISPPPALLFFCRCGAAAEPNFYDGWRRITLVAMVCLFLVNLGAGGRRDDADSIHPSIVDLTPLSLLFFCGRNTAVEPSL